MESKSSLILFALVALAAVHGGSAQTTHVVGDSLGWLVPPGGPIAYSTWASRYNFTVGDVLVFKFTTATHDVAEVTRAAFDACNALNPISMTTTGPANITLNSAGEHHFICTFTRHCDLGQKLAINVSAPTSTSPAPQPATPPPTATPSPVPVSAPAPSPAATTPSRAPQTYIVGDGMGWNVPASAGAYRIWANNKTFVVGDTLVFNFLNGTHNVAEVTRSALDSCNTTSPIRTISNSPARITLSTAGEHSYICTFPRHCSLGQSLSINVSAAATTAPTPSPVATPPSGSTTPPPGHAPSPSANSPSGSTGPDGASPPPPPSSATSLSVAALPAAFLSIAVAALYY